MATAEAGAGPHEAAFRSDPAALPRLVAFVRAAGQAMGLAPEDLLRLELVVEELAANSLAYGALPPELPLELRLERADDVVRIDYADHGRAFDPTSLADDRPRGAEGGFGWLLIRRYCPEPRYRRDAGRNRLALDLRLMG
jgi:anti-sigma regulatory factor (Ser/Thr protein kinase)